MRHGAIFRTTGLALLCATALVHAKPVEPVMDRAAYTDARDKIEARSDQAASQCKKAEGPEGVRRRCQIRVEGHRKIDLAALLARYHPSANNSFKALAAEVDLQYALDTDRCKATHVGHDRDTRLALKTCLDEAKQARAQGTTEAHQQAARLASVGTPPKSEAERQREADLDTAIRKCDSLLGDANLQCVNALSPEARQRAADRASGPAPKK